MSQFEDCNNIWLGFIVAEVVKQCIDLCKAECLACTSNMLCPVLHFHNELSLRDKIARHLKNVTLNIDALFDQFIIQFGWFSLDRAKYIRVGDAFLLVTTPDAIFYGKYITPQNEGAIYGQRQVTPSPPTTEPTVQITNGIKRKAKSSLKRPIKAKLPKLEPITENDHVLGAGV